MPVREPHTVAIEWRRDGGRVDVELPAQSQILAVTWGIAGIASRPCKRVMQSHNFSKLNLWLDSAGRLGYILSEYVVAWLWFFESRGCMPYSAL